MTTVPLPKLRRAFGLSMKVMRLSTFAAVVGGIFTVCFARSVYGSATQSVFNLNQELSQRTGELERQSYRVLVNGQAMMISSHMVDASMKEVLDEAEASCKASSGGLEADLAHLPKYAMQKVSSLIFGVVRRETEHRGFVACMENNRMEGAVGMSADLREVARTGDIGKLGTFRYVTVDRSPDAKRTHVLRQWTEGSFNLTALFPKEGDVPGNDLAELPRPDSSRRILDASIEGSRFGVHVYDAAGAPAAILAGYDRDMGPKGWRRIDLTEKEAGNSRVYDSGGGQIFLSVTPAASDHARSTVAIASMPN
jgi:hypothetical protein